MAAAGRSTVALPGRGVRIWSMPQRIRTNLSTIATPCPPAHAWTKPLEAGRQAAAKFSQGLANSKGASTERNLGRAWQGQACSHRGLAEAEGLQELSSHPTRALQGPTKTWQGRTKAWQPPGSQQGIMGLIEASKLLYLGTKERGGQGV